MSKSIHIISSYTVSKLRRFFWDTVYFFPFAKELTFFDSSCTPFMPLSIFHFSNFHTFSSFPLLFQQLRHSTTMFDNPHVSYANNTVIYNGNNDLQPKQNWPPNWFQNGWNIIEFLKFIPLFWELTYRSDHLTDFHTWWLKQFRLMQGGFSDIAPHLGGQISKKKFLNATANTTPV